MLDIDTDISFFVSQFHELHMGTPKWDKMQVTLCHQLLAIMSTDYLQDKIRTEDIHVKHPIEYS